MPIKNTTAISVAWFYSMSTCGVIKTEVSFLVCTNGLGDQGSIPGQIIPKTQKIVLDTTLHNTQYYKVWIKGKMEQSSGWSSALPYNLV